MQANTVYFFHEQRALLGTDRTQINSLNLKNKQYRETDIRDASHSTSVHFLVETLVTVK